MYEATGLVGYPGIEGYSSRRVDFGIEEIYEIDCFDPCRLKLPDEWVEAATKVAQKKVDLIVLPGSAISRACEKGHRVAYFGVTKSVDFLSYNCLGCLLELLKCLAEGSTTKVWCHISTPCTAGCGLRHLHLKNESFLPKWRNQIVEHIQGWNRIARLFAKHCDNPRLLLTQEWPERTDLWHEESYRRAARQLKLTRSGCRVERCCFDGVLKTWYFCSNQPLFVQEMMKYQKCSNDHEHRRVEVKESGFYPLEMGRVLLSAARGVLKKSLPRGEPQTVSSMRGRENLRDGSRFPAQTLLSEAGAAARECGNSLGTPGTLSCEAPGSSNPKFCRSRHSSCDPPQLASTESQLVTRANSHYNVWTVCVLYIRQLLLAAGNVSDERLEACRILSLLWRLLPVNRLRQIRIRLLHLQATF